MKSSEVRQAESRVLDSKLSLKPSLWGRVQVVRTAALAIVLVGLCVTWLSGIMDRRLDQMLDSERVYYNVSEMPSDGRPAFAATVPHAFKHPVPPGAGLGVRIKVAYFNLKQRLGIRDPVRTWMSPSPNQEWYVYQGLQHCTEVSGRRYLVAREGLGRVVSFESTKTVRGVQWVGSFEQALRDDGWVLITLRRGLAVRQGLVKVIPKDKLEEYRKAGLVKLSN